MPEEGFRRSGTRGGQADFSWEAVREDKHRENYLGNSINAAKGRWQEGRDIHWYNRDKNAPTWSSRDEIRAIKQAEQEQMNRLLGIETQTTGANAAPIDPAKRKFPSTNGPERESKSPNERSESGDSRREDRGSVSGSSHRHRHRESHRERDRDRESHRDHDRHRESRRNSDRREYDRRDRYSERREHRDYRRDYDYRDGHNSRRDADYHSHNHRHSRSRSRSHQESQHYRDHPRASLRDDMPKYKDEPSSYNRYSSDRLDRSESDERLDRTSEPIGRTRSPVRSINV
ncbi:hypothetical protein MCUN1_002175 [Malassezia cuniculi]|uniref:Multiple myeloma tumor-associated protein 2-like N-terminal domain-containing protein n=1 Tax=Malassezia cuniculi TaxID=948313 RepID=A0AAF0J752_9BASI|nr:hypothetical protein MCUN1_002175 [Malassezia cuniculi]